MNLIETEYIGTHSAAMGVNDNSQPIKLTHGVDAGGADSALSILRIPQLEVASSPLDTAGSELEFGLPLLLRNTIRRQLLPPWSFDIAVGLTESVPKRILSCSRGTGVSGSLCSKATESPSQYA